MATQTIERPVQRRAADLEALFPGRYLSVTSFKRDGTGVATPVWFVSDGRRLFALTDLHSAKVRRIRRNPRVLVAACRVDGKLRSEPVPARVEVLTADPGLGAGAEASDGALQDLVPPRDVVLPAGTPSPRQAERRRRRCAGDHDRIAVSTPAQTCAHAHHSMTLSRRWPKALEVGHA